MADTAQVGTRDGRVKIFGSDGVECTFRSPFQTSTKQLQFLENKGALLRLTMVSACTLPDTLPCSHSFLA